MKFNFDLTLLLAPYIIETFRNIYLFHTLWTFVMEKNDNKEFRFESIWRARFFKFNFFPSLYNELKSICQITTKKNHRVNGVPLDGFWHAIEIFRDEVGMQLLGSSISIWMRMSSSFVILKTKKNKYSGTADVQNYLLFLLQCFER